MKMMKIAAAFLAAILLSSSLYGCVGGEGKVNGGDVTPPSGNQENADGSTGTEEQITTEGISAYDWKYNGDDVMLTIDGKDFTFDLFRYYTMAMMTQFDMGDESYWNDETNAEFKDFMKTEFCKLRAIELLCEENKIEFSEASKKEITDFLDQFKAMYGEDILNQQLDLNYFTEQVYIDANKYGILLSELANTYVTDEEILTYAAENYVHVKHVLIGTLDEEGNEFTGEKLEEKTKLAEEITKRARDGEDFDALVKEYGEDPGMEASPEGYTFTYGMMVKEFEDESFRLAEGEISEPIKTSYGYHIILKLPLDPSVFTNKETQEYYDVANTLGMPKAEEAVSEKLESLEVIESEAFKELTVTGMGTKKS